jgi:hypothetical protein
MTTTIIRGGTVFDGRGGPGVARDVVVRDGVVADLLAPGAPAPDGTEIDASGCWVTPGFVDLHTHYDAELEVSPGLTESVRHGITTALVGSCGLSMAVGDPEDLADMFCRVEGIPRHLVLPVLEEVVTWDSPAGYLDHLTTLPLGTNVTAMVGHSTIRDPRDGARAGSVRRRAPRPRRAARHGSAAAVVARGRVPGSQRQHAAVGQDGRRPVPQPPDAVGVRTLGRVQVPEPGAAPVRGGLAGRARRVDQDQRARVPVGVRLPRDPAVAPDDGHHPHGHEVRPNGPPHGRGARAALQHHAGRGLEAPVPARPVRPLRRRARGPGARGDRGRDRGARRGRPGQAVGPAARPRLPRPVPQAVAGVVPGAGVPPRPRRGDHHRLPRRRGGRAQLRRRRPRTRPGPDRHVPRPAGRPRQQAALVHGRRQRPRRPAAVDHEPPGHPRSGSPTPGRTCATWRSTTSRCAC